MLCSYCGKEIKEDDTYCPFCGRKLKKQYGEEYVRPEKVRFSERWLVVKIMILWLFYISYISMTFKSGIDNILFLSDWTEFIMGFVLTVLFDYFIRRNVKGYGGNPYMLLKINIRDESILLITEIIKAAEKIVDFIFVILVIVRIITRNGFGGVLRLNVWLEAAQHNMGWVVLGGFIYLASSLLKTLRTYGWWKNRGVLEEDEE